MSRKRCATDHEGTTGQPPLKKRTEVLLDSASNVERWPNIRKRLRNYQDFKKGMWQFYCSILNCYYENVETDEASRIKLATALHDSLESNRFAALEQLRL